MEAKVFALAPGGGGASLILAIVALTGLAIAVAGGWMVWSGKRLSCEVGRSEIRIRGDLYGRTIPAASVVSESARRLDFRESPELRPVLRTNGIGLPGYQSGWFKLKNGEKALLFVTDWSRAVVVPTREGYELILSPSDPEGFLAALKGSSR